jgi:hypothetical protein
MPHKNKRSLEQIYRSAVSGLYARLRSNDDFIYGKFGDDGIKLIADMSREYGLNWRKEPETGWRIMTCSLWLNICKDI